MKELRSRVENMVEELLLKIEQSVPEEGNFPMVYSELKITDRKMCLTDVLLKFEAIPEHLPDSKTRRWLELVGYKLPVPIKCTRIIFLGSTKETILFLKQPRAVEKILNAMPELDYNLSDV